MSSRSAQASPRAGFDPSSVKGFLDPEEGQALARWAAVGAEFGPCLEIGSYCGRSTAYIGGACQAVRSTLFAVDHHRGSEEHQVGQTYHDPSLFDVQRGEVDTFPALRRTIDAAGLGDVVVPIVAHSAAVARHWGTGLGLVFIDGSHSFESARSDYAAWSGHVLPGGILAIHDVFFDPAQGGQAPREIYQAALDSGRFELAEQVQTLAILRRVVRGEEP